MMLSQSHLETPDCAETGQEKTPEPQKDEDNILPLASSVIPASSSPQPTMFPAQAITEMVETQQYHVEVLKQERVERRDWK